jgi:hypothetical protein
MVRTVHRWLTATLAVAAGGLAACGDDNGAEVRTVTTEAEPETPVTRRRDPDRDAHHQHRTPHGRGSRRVLDRRVGVLPGRQRRRRRQPDGDHHVQLSRRPSEDPLRTDATKPGPERRLGGRERHRRLRRAAGRRNDGGQVRERSPRAPPGDLHRHDREVSRLRGPRRTSPECGIPAVAPRRDRVASADRHRRRAARGAGPRRSTPRSDAGVPPPTKPWHDGTPAVTGVPVRWS